MTRVLDGCIMGSMKYLILLFLLLIPFSVSAVLTDYQFWGSPEDGWYFTTPDFQYFAYWQGEELWAMWVFTDNPVANCLIISEGEPKKCSVSEFSIILHYFPFK